MTVRRRQNDSVSVGSLAVVGLVMMLASAAFPWVRAQASSTSITLSPLGTEAFRPSAVLVLFVAVVGAVIFVVNRRTTALIGVAGSLWGTFAVIVWYLGLRLQWLLPDTILSNESAVQLTPAIALAIVGAALAVVATVADAVFATFRIRQVPRIPVVRLSLACTAVALLLWGRGFRWVVVDTARVSFAIGADSIPGIGDLVGVSILAIIVLVMISLVAPRRGIAISIMILATVVTMISTVGYAAGRVLRGGVESALRHYGALSGVPFSVEAGAGALVTASAGLCGVVFGGVILIQAANARGSRTVTPVKNGAPPAIEASAVDF